MTTKILVVDDEQLLEYVIQQKFRQKIRTKEIEFVFAHNGKEALEKIAEFPPFDLVLTDINMPEMDGLALLEKLSQIDNTLKAVVISAYGDMQNIRSAMNRGAFDFLTKPIDFQDMEP
jgi:YesN/AraC family two-component response regulator